MTRQDLEHVIRAAAGNANTRDIVVIGSQAILGTYPDAPPELLKSMEADVFPLDAPERSIVIDGAIGELSLFHTTFGYYAHGVDETTAVLPDGWRDRLVPGASRPRRQQAGRGAGKRLRVRRRDDRARVHLEANPARPPQHHHGHAAEDEGVGSGKAQLTLINAVCAESSHRTPGNGHARPADRTRTPRITPPPFDVAGACGRACRRRTERWGT